MSGQPPKKNSILKDAGIYSIATILAQAISLVAGILTRRFLGPTQMGVWSLLQIILSYSTYATLGASESIFREIPFYEGKGDKARADEIKNLVFSFSMLMSVGLAVVVACYALAFRATLSVEIFYGFFFVAALIVLHRLNNFYIGLLRSYKFFVTASKQNIASAIVNALLIGYFAWQYKIYGFMIALCLSFLFNIGFVLFHHRFHLRWVLDRKKLYELIQYGFPLMTIGLFSTIFLSIDKLMIANMLGVRELGLYSVAILAYTYMSNIPNSIGAVLVPNFHEKFGKNEKVEDVSGYLSASSVVFSDLMPVLIATGWFLIPYFARLLLPEFIESIAPVQTLILSAYFLALLQPYSYFLTLLRKQIYLLPILLVSCLVAVVSNYLVLSMGYGLVGVGVATTIVLFIKFSATFFLASPYAFKRSEYWRSYLVYICKFIYMATILFGLTAIFPQDPHSLTQALLQLFIFMVLYSPFLWRLNREFNVITRLKKKFEKPVSLPSSAADL